MSLQHLLDSIPEPTGILWNINTLEALCRKLNLKFKVFIACDSTNILYGSYLLRYLEILRAWSEQYGEPSYYDRTLDLAECKIVHYLKENDMLSITPLVFYASHKGLDIGEINHLPEVNLSSETQHCCLSVRWQRGSSGFRRAEIEALFSFTTYFLICEDEEWLSRWIRQSMRLMCLCLTLLGNDTIKRAKDPTA
ncbi:hypothetical protein CVT25_005292 [Psilocybe cyanescens]|uniref:Uncharacterized protein n=1 Tax=Psilocybe cyanescens TaxID=93625 RepID=A0A409XBY2_PSICY|nr:hypothetical protein CVT25_005292 [Psilocybe cyanescens]